MIRINSKFILAVLVTILFLKSGEMVVTLNEEGYYFAIGSGSSLKHNHLAIEFQVIKIQESASIVKQNAVSMGLSNRSNRIHKQPQPFGRFMASNESGGEANLAGMLNEMDREDTNSYKDVDVLASRYTRKIYANATFDYDIAEKCGNKVGLTVQLEDYNRNKDGNKTQEISAEITTDMIIFTSLKGSTTSNRKIKNILNNVCDQISFYFNHIEKKEHKDNQALNKIRRETFKKTNGTASSYLYLSLI